MHITQRHPKRLTTPPRNRSTGRPATLAKLPASWTGTTELPGTAQISREPMPPADPVVPQDFQLTDDGVQTFSAVVQNDYFVNELAPPSGWEFVSLDCSASSDSTEFTITGTQVDFTIDEAIDTLDCTYTNQAKANLHFVKDAERGGVDFSYATTGGLDPSTFALADGEQQDYADLDPGTYGATETVPAGWNLTRRTVTTVTPLMR